jgi:hypothetical protein
MSQRRVSDTVANEAWKRSETVMAGPQRAGLFGDAPHPGGPPLRAFSDAARRSAQRCGRRVAVELARLTRRRRASTGVRRIRRTPPQEVAAGPQRGRMPKRSGTNGPARRRIVCRQMARYSHADAVWGKGIGVAGWYGQGCQSAGAGVSGMVGLPTTDNMAGYMKSTPRAFLILSVAITAATAFASSAMGQRTHAPTSTDSPIDPNQPTGRSALRRIVQDQCVLNWQKDHKPAPCERVFLVDPKDSSSGYAVIAAPGGGAHYLLVPTRTMTGIESSELLDPDAPNYFAEAWRAKGLLGTFVGHDVPRTGVGLVVDIVQSRARSISHSYRVLAARCLRGVTGIGRQVRGRLVAHNHCRIGISGAANHGRRLGRLEFVRVACDCESGCAASHGQLHSHRCGHAI